MKRKVAKNILKAVVFTVCVLLVNKIVEYCVYDGTSCEIVKYMYEEKDNIDILILGSSHADVSFDTDMMERELGKNVFNAGTQVQKPDASYYILKEAIKSNGIETVYMDMFYYMYHDYPEMRTTTQLEFIYRVSDDMKWSMDKIEFLLRCSTPDYYLHNFVKASRNGSELLNLEFVENNIKQKRHPESQIIDYDNEINRDVENRLIPDVRYQFGKPEPFSTKNISDYSEQFIRKMAGLCEKNGIRFVLVATPMTDFQLEIFTNYDNYISEVRKLAEELNIEYYDYNLCDEDILGLTDDCFSDMHHLNEKGSDIFTKKFIEFESRKQDYNAAFYNRFSDKIAEMPAKCLGIEVIWNEEQKQYYIEPICTQKDLQLLYHIYSLDNTNNDIVVNDDEPRFYVEKGSKYAIEFKDANKEQLVRYYEIDF